MNILWINKKEDFAKDEFDQYDDATVDFYNEAHASAKHKRNFIFMD